MSSYFNSYDGVCFNDLVGLRGSCDFKNSTSGLYINDLPGIEMKKISALADGDAISGEKLFERFYNDSVKELKSLIRARLRTGFFFKKVLQKSAIGTAYRDFSSPPVVNKGFYIKRNSFDEYQCLVIESISFKAATAGCYNLEINNGTTVQNVQVKARAGLNKIYLNYETLQDRVDFKFTEFLLDIADTTPLGSTYACGCNECIDCSCDACSIGCFSIRMTEERIVNDIPTIFETGSNGLTITAYCKCSDENLFCKFSQEVALALRLIIGINIMTEASVSASTHPLVRNKKEDAERLLMSWKGVEDTKNKFKEPSLLDTYLNNIVNQMQDFLQMEESLCKDCDEGSQTQTALP